MNTIIKIEIRVVLLSDCTFLYWLLLRRPTLKSVVTFQKKIPTEICCLSWQWHTKVLIPDVESFLEPSREGIASV